MAPTATRVEGKLRGVEVTDVEARWRKRRGCTPATFEIPYRSDGSMPDLVGPMLLAKAETFKALVTFAEVGGDVLAKVGDLLGKALELARALPEVPGEILVEKIEAAQRTARFQATLATTSTPRTGMTRDIEYVADWLLTLPLTRKLNRQEVVDLLAWYGIAKVDTGNVGMIALRARKSRQAAPRKP